MAQYSIRSLNDLADHFDEMAKRSIDQNNGVKGKHAQECQRVAARTWAQAADVLRNTTINH